MPIQTTARQQRLYTETCTIWKRSRTIGAGGVPGAETWTSFATDVPYFHQSTANLGQPNEIGRFVEPSILTTDIGHFYAEQPFPQDFIIQNTTVGGRKNGYYAGLGPGEPHPSAGNRRANVLRFFLRQIPAPAGLPFVRLRDDFTDDDGVLLANHAMNAGPGWTVSASNAFQIESNQAQVINAARVAYADSGSASGTLTVDVNFASQANDLGLFFRGVDGSNGFLFDCNALANNVALYERTTGVDTARAGPTPYVFDLTSDWALKVTMSGNVLTCFVNDVQVLTYTTASKNTNTVHGFFSGGASGAVGQTFDNLLFIG